MLAMKGKRTIWPGSGLIIVLNECSFSQHNPLFSLPYTDAQPESHDRHDRRAQVGKAARIAEYLEELDIM
jgi:hypothetical protein